MSDSYPRDIFEGAVDRNMWRLVCRYTTLGSTSKVVYIDMAIMKLSSSFPSMRDYEEQETCQMRYQPFKISSGMWFQLVIAVLVSPDHLYPRAKVRLSRGDRT
jgi:hypothetical protein